MTHLAWCKGLRLRLLLGWNRKNCKSNEYQDASLQRHKTTRTCTCRHFHEQASGLSHFWKWSEIMSVPCSTSTWLTWLTWALRPRMKRDLLEFSSKGCKCFFFFFRSQEFLSCNVMINWRLRSFELVFWFLITLLRYLTYNAQFSFRLYELI